ncbi:hypothetical protein [Rhizobium sp. 9140]|uniref:hypothetical protein n=1 Tax=Rhizobium sp. 9140 TaxID=1761900 RepID=UPI0011125DAF|nr:hypothetical protein [Rhizobium sp. 9140]
MADYTKMLITLKKKAQLGHRATAFRKFGFTLRVLQTFDSWSRVSAGCLAIIELCWLKPKDIDRP